MTSILSFYKGFILKNDLFEKQFSDFCKAAVENSSTGLPTIYTKKSPSKFLLAWGFSRINMVVSLEEFHVIYFDIKR